jgi:hypothetical protein
MDATLNLSLRTAEDVLDSLLIGYQAPSKLSLAIREIVLPTTR